MHLGCGDFVLLRDAGIPAATPLVELESLQLSLLKRVAMGCKKSKFVISNLRLGLARD